MFKDRLRIKRFLSLTLILSILSISVLNFVEDLTAYAAAEGTKIKIQYLSSTFDPENQKYTLQTVGSATEQGTLVIPTTSGTENKFKKAHIIENNFKDYEFRDEEDDKKDKNGEDWKLQDGYYLYFGSLTVFQNFLNRYDLTKDTDLLNNTTREGDFEKYIRELNYTDDSTHPFLYLGRDLSATTCPLNTGIDLYNYHDLMTNETFGTDTVTMFAIGMPDTDDITNYLNDEMDWTINYNIYYDNRAYTKTLTSDDIIYPNPATLTLDQILDARNGSDYLSDALNSESFPIAYADNSGDIIDGTTQNITSLNPFEVKYSDILDNAVDYDLFVDDNVTKVEYDVNLAIDAYESGLDNGIPFFTYYIGTNDLSNDYMVYDEEITNDSRFTDIFDKLGLNVSTTLYQDNSTNTGMKPKELVQILVDELDLAGNPTVKFYSDSDRTIETSEPNKAKPAPGRYYFKIVNTTSIINDIVDDTHGFIDILPQIKVYRAGWDAADDILVSKKEITDIDITTLGTVNIHAIGVADNKYRFYANDYSDSEKYEISTTSAEKILAATKLENIEGAKVTFDKDKYTVCDMDATSHASENLTGTLNAEAEVSINFVEKASYPITVKYKLLDDTGKTIATLTDTSYKETYSVGNTKKITIADKYATSQDSDGTIWYEYKDMAYHCPAENTIVTLSDSNYTQYLNSDKTGIEVTFEYSQGIIVKVVDSYYEEDGTTLEKSETRQTDVYITGESYSYSCLTKDGYTVSESDGYAKIYSGTVSDDMTIEFAYIKDAALPTLTGHVYDTSGNPLSGITVELQSTLRTTTTDSNGAYEFKDVTKESHTLTFKSGGSTLYAMQFDSTTPTSTIFKQFSAKTEDNTASIGIDNDGLTIAADVSGLNNDLSKSDYNNGSTQLKKSVFTVDDNSVSSNDLVDDEAIQGLPSTGSWDDTTPSQSATNNNGVGGTNQGANGTDGSNGGSSDGNSGESASKDSPKTLDYTGVQLIFDFALIALAILCLVIFLINDKKQKKNIPASLSGFVSFN